MAADVAVSPLTRKRIEALSGSRKSFGRATSGWLPQTEGDWGDDEGHVKDEEDAETKEATKMKALMRIIGRVDKSVSCLLFVQAHRHGNERCSKELYCIGSKLVAGSLGMLLHRPEENISNQPDIWPSQPIKLFILERLSILFI